MVDTEHGVNSVQAKSPNSHRVLFWVAEKQQIRFWEIFDSGTEPTLDTYVQYKTVEEGDKRKLEVTYLGGPVEWTDTYVEAEETMEAGVAVAGVGEGAVVEEGVAGLSGEGEMEETFECPDCGKELAPEATICPACGAEFEEEEEEVFECPECGTTLTAEATVCPSCGSEFEDEDEDEEAEV